MKILFLHGWQSLVGGVKPTFLKNAGHQIINPALDHDNFERALQTAQQAYDAQTPDVIVGSSRGGAVAMNMASGSTPLVLLCPAWKNWGTAAALKSNAVILHSRLDEIIPFCHSEELIQQSGLPPENLLEVGSDHRLADEGSLAVMLWACSLLASGQTIPTANDGEPGQAAGAAAWTTHDSSSEKEGSYVCDACGEEIVIPLDVTEGSSQSYVEDCPVCCRANVIHMEMNADGSVLVWAEPEQDHD